jgi:acetyl-CoA carboxylase biotin carboxyl carrier protein
MNFKEIRELIEMVSSKESIEEFEVERSGFRLRIKRPSNSVPTAPSTVVPESSDQPAPTLAPIPSDSPGLAYVTSPIVGSFYRASSPDEDPFVNVGDFVEKGSVVCIIEAMKLMNEIESEVAGEIVSIAVENGNPVEYGERLFVVRPR